MKLMSLAALIAVANAGIIPNTNILSRASDKTIEDALEKCYSNECSSLLNDVDKCGMDFSCYCDAAKSMSNDCAKCLEDAGTSSDDAKKSVCNLSDVKNIPSSLTDKIPSMTSSVASSQTGDSNGDGDNNDDDDSSSQSTVPSIAMAVSALVLAGTISI